VWTLTPPSGDWKTGTWTWTQVAAAAGSESPTANSNGTFGRFRFVPALGAFIVVNSVGGPVYMYKLTANAGTGGGGSGGGGTTPSPTISFSASPATLTAGAAATLTWSATNATACTASGDWSGAKAVSGSASTGALSAAKSYVLSCTGAGGSATQSVAVAVSDPSTSADFSTRCTGPGVQVCVGFDATSDIASTYLKPDGQGVYRGVLDATNKASGASSLKFTIPGNSGANAAGQYLRTTTGFGQNSSFYVQYRMRFSSTFLNTYFQPGNGWKTHIFYGPASCGNVEITTRSYGGTNQFPIMYSQCGQDNFSQSIGNGDYLLQQGDYNCHYQGPRPDTECGRFRADEWMTFYYQVNIGQWGQPNSTIKAWMGYEGQPLKQFVNMANHVLLYDSVATESYKNFSLTTYMTGKDSSQAHAPADVWYDEFIVSSQPIPAPNGTVSPPDPVAPTVTLSASPSSIVSGASTQLSWSSTNATACSAAGAWSGAKGLSGQATVGPLTANASFTLACANGAGVTASKTVQVTVTGGSTPPPAPTVALMANPSSIASGATSALSWSSTNAASCSASGAWSGAKAVSGTEVTSALTQNTSYSLSCVNSAGVSAQASLTVVVSAAPPSPAPIISFDSTKDTVVVGESALLFWRVAYASTCDADNAWDGTKPLIGTEPIWLDHEVTYTLRCTGPGGSTSRSVTVQAVQAGQPQIVLDAAAATLQAGEATTLTWSVTDATSCTATGGWSGAKAMSGSQSTGNLSSNTSFTLACTGTGGSNSRQINVTVQQAPGSGDGGGSGGGGIGAMGLGDSWLLFLLALGRWRRRLIAGMGAA
jgi:hypothetical protein